MEKVSEKVLIMAPPEKVFSFMARPSNLPRLIPLIRSAEATPGGIRAVAAFSGIDFPLDFRKEMWEKNRAIGLRAEIYGATVEIGVLLKPLGKGTETKVSVGYDAPQSLAAFLPEDSKKRLADWLRESLRSLKASLEAS